MLKNKVLDKGFIEVVDSLGNDLTVVNSARVSFGKRKKYWDKSDERLVKYEESRYNPKTDKLEFCTRHFRKPLLIMRVGRFHGDKPKKPVKLDWSYRMYDLSLDRINLVLCNG